MIFGAGYLEGRHLLYELEGEPVLLCCIVYAH